MKDYLSHYGHTEVSTPVRSFQAGGGAPAPAAPAPAPQGGAPAPAGPVGPEAGGGDLQAELMQVVETQDPQLALAFCNKLGEQLAAASQGAPAGPEGAPVPGAMPGGVIAPNSGGGMGMPGGTMPGYGADGGTMVSGMYSGGAGSQPFQYKKGGKMAIFAKDGLKVSFKRK